MLSTFIIISLLLYLILMDSDLSENETDAEIYVSLRSLVCVRTCIRRVIFALLEILMSF